MSTEIADFKDLFQEEPAHAMEWLYTSYRDRIFRAAFLYFNDSHTAEDLCHDVFTAAAAKAEAFDGRSGAYTWLYSIMLNKARDMIRKRGTISRNAGKLRPLAEDRLRQEDPARLAEQAEVRDSVLQAIDGLPEDMRSLIIMRYYENFSGEEMAAALDISHARVRTRLTEARTLLRKNLVKEVS